MSKTGKLVLGLAAILLLGGLIYSNMGSGKHDVGSRGVQHGAVEHETRRVQANYGECKLNHIRGFQGMAWQNSGDDLVEKYAEKAQFIDSSYGDNTTNGFVQVDKLNVGGVEMKPEVNYVFFDEKLYKMFFFKDGYQSKEELAKAMTTMLGYLEDKYGKANEKFDMNKLDGDKPYRIFWDDPSSNVIINMIGDSNTLGYGNIMLVDIQYKPLVKKLQEYRKAWASQRGDTADVTTDALSGPTVKALQR